MIKNRKKINIEMCGLGDVSSKDVFGVTLFGLF